MEKLLYSITAFIVGCITATIFCNTYREESDVLTKIEYIDSTKYENLVADNIVVKDEINISLDDFRFYADTIRIHDTVYIQLPREEKTYENDEFKIVISGFKPNLDYAEFYHKNTVTTKVVPKKARWGLGIHAGYGASIYQQRIIGVPYIGIGLSYNIFSW